MTPSATVRTTLDLPIRLPGWSGIAAISDRLVQLRSWSRPRRIAARSIESIVRGRLVAAEFTNRSVLTDIPTSWVSSDTISSVVESGSFTRASSCSSISRLGAIACTDSVFGFAKK